jgi:hypothetical protein
MGARLAAIVAAIVAATGTLVLAPSAFADTAASTNWAGYAVHRTGLSYRAIQAAWRQPRVSCRPGARTFSSYWVGLGGFSESSQAIEQIGTEADCTRFGVAKSTAWYELLPAPSMPIRLSVHPGDLMAAQVTVKGHAVTFTLIDASTHRSFTKNLRAGSIDVSSAEWIVEAPSDCPTNASCLTLPLANFGSASFTQSAAETAGGHAGTINDPFWRSTKITLDPGGGQFVSASSVGAAPGGASAGPLDATGGAFTVTYAGAASPPGGFRGSALVGSVRSTQRR